MSLYGQDQLATKVRSETLLIVREGESSLETRLEAKPQENSRRLVEGAKTLLKRPGVGSQK